MNDGIERQLIEFAESAKPPGETAWFSFDRLTFETDSATIQMLESREQLQNIVEILKAYPAMRIKIGGYTDNTGDGAHNVRLSKAQTEATEKALVSMGIDA